MTSAKSLVFVACAAAGFVAAQPSQGMKARELFYSAPVDPGTQKPIDPPPTVDRKTTVAKNTTRKRTAATTQETHTVAASVPLGLKYSLLRREIAGAYQPVTTPTTFQPGTGSASKWIPTPKDIFTLS